MPKLDAFSQQIVDLVRQMPDEAILELVKNQLGVVTGSDAPSASNGATSSGSRTTKRKAKATRKKKRSGRKGGSRSSAAREEAMASVESAIKSSKGMSASQIATKTKLPQSRVSSLVRELKAQGRIHQGGDRRFARYAGDAKTAKKASEDARNNASGPQVKKGRAKKKSSRRKR